MRIILLKHRAVPMTPANEEARHQRLQKEKIKVKRAPRSFAARLVAEKPFERRKGAGQFNQDGSMPRKHEAPGDDFEDDD